MSRQLRYPLVFFDVDSTLVTIEGIDVLANGNAEIAALTEAAMNGAIPVESVYGKRLEIIRPTRDHVERLSKLYLRSIVPGAEEVMGELRAAGAAVHLVTGGIEQAILPLAEHLGIAPRAVHAVPLHFDDRGGYRDYDRRSQLAQSGGKELVILDVRARTKGKAAFVGDGMTDAEARGAVDLFIGFGGVTIRQRVRELAEVYVNDASLAAILPLLFQER
jgi:phosphoserine phosphatase